MFCLDALIAGIIAAIIPAIIDIPIQISVCEIDIAKVSKPSSFNA